MLAPKREHYTSYYTLPSGSWFTSMTRLVSKQKSNFQPSECQTRWLLIQLLLTPGHTHTHTHCLVPCSIPSLPLPTPLLTPAATSIQLRYDVFVDTIHKIEITTTTRELLLEKAPEMFDVRAFDEEGTRLCVSLSSVHGVLRHGHQCIPIPLIITSGSDTCLVS